MSNPVIITAAVNGAETTREQNPNVPFTPEEIGQEAQRCREAGASIVHVHGREPDGAPTQDRETFRRILRQIRDRTDVIVQFSTGGAVGMDLEERIDAIDLEPEMATLTTGTVNFGDEIFENSWPTITSIAEAIQRHGITPEIEIFDTGMVDTAMRLVEEGLLELPAHFDFVLGVPGGMGARRDSIEYLMELIPEGSTWSVAGVGKYEFPMAEHALEMGGHVRVGLEDNVYLKKGVLAEGSWQLVDKVSSMAEAVGRELADPSIARDMLGLPST